ncbi:MAG: hydrolase, partial [Comamonadaceae bacterium]
MKIAAYLDQGRPCVGIVSSDLLTVLPLQVSPEQAKLGALPIVELLAAGQQLPATGAPSFA